MSLASHFAIAGVSACPVAFRFGVKGSGAAASLAQQGIAVPASPNHVVRWSDYGGGRCLRLGNAEFLVEHDVGPAGSAPAALPSSGVIPGTEDAWVLLRSDASFVLDGPAWPRELSQACSFDFTRLHAEPDLVVMTLLAGIGVTLVREPVDGERLALRLWCDASYSLYLQDCLHQLALPLAGEQR
jgi:sarcosine oxidase subunit gamma